MPWPCIVHKSLSHMSAEHIDLSSLTALGCPHTHPCISCNHNVHRIQCACLCWGGEGTCRAEARPTGRSWGSWGARMGLKLPSRSHFVVDRDQWEQSISSACSTSLSEDSRLTCSWKLWNQSLHKLCLGVETVQAATKKKRSLMVVYSLFMLYVPKTTWGCSDWGTHFSRLHKQT